MSHFLGLNSQEMEFASGRDDKDSLSRPRDRSRREKISRTISSSRKFIFKKSYKKPSCQSPLFIPTKFVNSLKKVQLRKKKEKFENNNFLYQERRNSLSSLSSIINDRDFQMVKDLPLIPFPPNQLPNFSEKSKSSSLGNNLKIEEKIKHHNLDRVLREARTQWHNERNRERRKFVENDYVLLTAARLHVDNNRLCPDTDYVEMNSFINI